MVLIKEEYENPQDYEILSLFGVEPTFSSDINQVPYFYNRSTYTFSNNEKQQFLVSLDPAYGEITIIIDDEGERICSLSFRNTQSLEILKDNEKESRIMILDDRRIIKLNFKPRFMIFIEKRKSIIF